MRHSPFSQRRSLLPNLLVRKLWWVILVKRERERENDCKHSHWLLSISINKRLLITNAATSFFFAIFFLYIFYPYFPSSVLKKLKLEWFKCSIICSFEGRLMGIEPALVPSTTPTLMLAHSLSLNTKFNTVSSRNNVFSAFN